MRRVKFWLVFCSTDVLISLPLRRSCHRFQYGMKIVQGHTAFFCPYTPIFAFKQGKFPFALFTFLKTDFKFENQALFTFSCFTLIGIGFLIYQKNQNDK